MVYELSSLSSILTHPPHDTRILMIFYHPFTLSMLILPYSLIFFFTLYTVLHIESATKGEAQEGAHTHGNRFREPV